MHQGAWVVWALLAGGAALSTDNPFYLVPLCTAAFAVHSVHRSDGPQARSFRVLAAFALVAVILRVALVFVGPSDISVELVAAAFLEGSRLAAMLLIFGAFNSVADPYRLLKLSPRRFHEPALAASLALSIAPRTIEATARVREAQRLRGIELRGLRVVRALAVPVLETGMEEAVTLAESMDARGHGRGARTRYRPERWTRRSWLVAGGAVLGIAIILGSGVAGGGSLTVTTFPLGWPGARAEIVLAMFLFAIPALLPPENQL